MAEQLLIPSKAFHRHYNSPALLACYDAMWDFESKIEQYFGYEDEYELMDILEDLRHEIGVSDNLNDAKREQLELWEFRYRESIKLLVKQKGIWTTDQMDIKNMTI